MSGESADKQGFFARGVPLKWVFVSAAGLIVVFAAIVVAVVLVDQSRDNSRKAEAAAATSTTGVTSPYDLTELPADAELDAIEHAAFVSILVPNVSGTLTSYGISSDLPAAQALTQAIRDADDVDPGTPASSTGNSAGQAGVVSTITFVLPTRETLTFGLDLDQGLITRGDRAWRPRGDLRALVETAIAGPQ